MMENHAAQETAPGPDGVRDLAVSKRVADPGRAVAPVPRVGDETSALISMIERAARDPAVDLDKMERLYAMKERMDATMAKAAYISALAEMQPNLPIIDKRGKIERKSKDSNGSMKEARATKYALWEDVVEAITPILSAHGFSLSFRIKQDARVEVTAVLGHRAGHCEETSMSLPIDESGAKNNLQGWGSSVSYGKRYTAFALLNIIARGEDDDGNAAGDTSASTPVTPEDLATLKSLIDETDYQIGKVCEYYSVESLDDLTRKQYEHAKALLTTKRNQMRKAKA
jgi:hypothetical protein